MSTRTGPAPSSRKRSRACDTSSSRSAGGLPAIDVSDTLTWLRPFFVYRKEVRKQATSNARRPSSQASVQGCFGNLSVQGQAGNAREVRRDLPAHLLQHPEALADELGLRDAA